MNTPRTKFLTKVFSLALNTIGFFLHNNSGKSCLPNKTFVRPKLKLVYNAITKYAKQPKECLKTEMLKNATNYIQYILSHFPSVLHRVPSSVFLPFLSNIERMDFLK